MKLPVLIVIVVLLFSCDKKEEIKQIENTHADTTKIKKVTSETDTLDLELNLNSVTNPNDAECKNEFNILIPRSYRDWEGKNDADALNEKWRSLTKKNEKYFLEKASYKISGGYDECVGDSTKIIEAKNTLLFLDNTKLKLGSVNSVPLTKKKIWPSQKWSFTFNSKKYQLHAKGKLTSKEKFDSNDGDDAFHEVSNYKLYISVENEAETLLFQQDSFNDTFVELLFIGDLDRDGKPDFIFSANRNYEEERVVLYLSSRARNGKSADQVSEIAVQFDC